MRLLQCEPMADWRQIQARIRKAKSGKDPSGQLAQLFERTRDAMVAFELAKLHEKSGEIPEAVRWYTAAAERFRRAQWKTKAEEALARLGAPTPAAPPLPSEIEPAAMEGPREEPEAVAVYAPTVGIPEAPATPQEDSRQAAAKGLRRRRRGRRGGRGRRRKEPAQLPAVRAVPETPPAPTAPLPRKEVPTEQAPEPARPREIGAVPIPWQPRIRTGEPALASRLARLESELRRLLASPPHRLEETEQMPAGPGVFLLTDSEQTTSYYVEDCQTLRIGIGNLLRSGRGGGRSGESLRARLTEHLGVSEARAFKYLKEQCAVRWLQLDEGASALAHFAISLLRPVLND